MIRRSAVARPLLAGALAVALSAALATPLLAQDSTVRAVPGLRAADSLVPQRPLTLLDAIRLGRARGVNAAIARLGARASAAQADEARAGLLPTIGGGGGVTRQTVNLDEFGFPGVSGVTPAFDIWRFRASAGQTLFDASTITRLGAARQAAAAAGLDARATGDAAGASAGLAYLRALSADETVRARQADSTVAADLLDQSRRLVDAGVSPAIDLTRSQVSFEAVRTQLEVARNARDRAGLDLRRALDLPAAAPLQLADSLGAGEAAIPTAADEAVRYAREHRAELAAEQARTRAARSELRAIKFENVPNLGLNGFYQFSGQGLGTLRGSYAVALQLNVPVLDGFRRQARAQEQSFRVDAQALRERDLGNQVETEVRQSLLDLGSARQQVALATNRLRLAEQELAQAEERFRAGVAGSVETTQAQSSLIAARDALIQARVNYGTARVNTYRALGVLDQLH